jgi:hypothetical protein
MLMLMLTAGCDDVNAIPSLSIATPFELWMEASHDHDDDDDGDYKS